MIGFFELLAFSLVPAITITMLWIVCVCCTVLLICSQVT